MEREKIASESPHPKPVRIFLVFDREDRRFRDDMITQLAVLRRNGKIDDWHEYEGYAGSDWQSVDNERLNQADIILLFITPHFIASDYCYRVQHQALVRHNADEARVIPILFRPVHWRDLPCARLLRLPLHPKKGILPVSAWRDKNEAYVGIVKGIQYTIEELPRRNASPTPPKDSEGPIMKRPSPVSGTLHLIYHGHSAYVIDVAWSPDGKYIASGGGDSTVRVWSASTGNTLYTNRGQKGITLTGILFSEIWSIVWSPDSKRLAFAGKKAPQVWEPGNDRNIATYHGHSSFFPVIANMAWSPDGQFIASTNIGSLKDQALHIWFPENGLQAAKFDVSSGLTDTSPIGGVAWSSDSRRIACGLHGEVRIYDIRTKQHLQTYRSRSTYAYYSVCWTPDGKRLVCSYPKQAVVWDVITGNTLYTYNDHTADIRDLALSPNGKYVASASNDRTVHIWETETGKRVFRYQGHENEVTAVTWSPDGTQIASACKDGTVHVWQAI